MTPFQPIIRSLFALALLALTAAGCVTGGSGPATFGGGSAQAVAFESIDGPPPAVFSGLVATLTAETQAHRISVVPRSANAAYRARGYLAAHVRRGETIIAWVWDIYDARQERALRLAGEEPAGRAGRDPWAAANDDVIARIARSTAAGMAVLMSEGAAAPAATEAQEGAALAAAPASAALSFVAADPTAQ